jgi:mycothiol synthase
MQPDVTVRVESMRSLGQPDLDSVSALAGAATEADGVAPLGEATVLAMLSGRAHGSQHLLVLAGSPTQGEPVAGYAHLDITDPQRPSAELVVHPEWRRHGVGRLLVEQLQRAVPGDGLRVWAHGQLPGAAALADRLGYRVERELWQMRRPLTSPLPGAPVPADLSLRSFRPGEDDEAWLALNAAAFAHHPEQGAWTLEDLRLRMAEPWFDPEGFLLLEDADGALAGFHWTKVHPADAEGPAAGEVYVVGVAPAQQGRGLGRVLTVAGLQHLRGRGLAQALLYVDADNAAAVRTYQRLGFTRSHVDVQYRREPHCRVPDDGATIGA